MPHRDPLFAALARCAQLRARIAELAPDARVRFSKPLTLAAAVAEAERLTSFAAALERGTPPTSTDDEIPPIVDDAVNVRDDMWTTTPENKGDRRRAGKAAVFGFVIASMVVVFLVYFHPRTPKTAAAARAPRARSIIVSGTVVERGGAIDVRGGDRCTITVTDGGERSSSPSCLTSVTCSSLVQRFSAASCPIREDGSVRMANNGLDLDTIAGEATFTLWDERAELPLGTAKIVLDR